MFSRLIRAKILKSTFLFILTLSLNSCIYLVVGGVGAVGGYVVSPDTVEGIITGYSFDEVWQAAGEVVSIMGVINEESEGTGVMLTKIQGAKTTITVYRMSDTAMKVNVKARKFIFPSIGVAQDVYIKITKYLDDVR